MMKNTSPDQVLSYLIESIRIPPKKRTIEIIYHKTKKSFFINHPKSVKNLPLFANLQSKIFANFSKRHNIKSFIKKFF